jgi:hypothetical protein
MIRNQHLDIALHQSRHRVLCGILSQVEEGKSLIERARLLGFPVDWHDPRPYPNRHGYSDFGATFLLAKDVCRAESAKFMRMTGQPLDRTALDSHATRQAKQEATTIFNRLIQEGIELSGHAHGRYYTCKLPLHFGRPAGLH